MNAPVTTIPRLCARNITVGYGRGAVLEDLDLEIPSDRVTTLIGPNGCGKSTLLKSLCGLLPYQGVVELEGRDLKEIKRRERATRMTLLPQAPVAPDGLTVEDLVARGRHPHQSWLAQWSHQDEDEVHAALEATGVEQLAKRPLAELSGGQRQRAWIAMALAQDTPTILLDEPTTYLDLSFSVEVLRMVRRFADERGKTVLMVLHDLNLAARHSDQLVVIAQGRVMAQGAPAEVLTEAMLRQAFDLDAVVADDPVTGGPLVVPA